MIALALRQPVAPPCPSWDAAVAAAFGTPNNRVSWLHLHFHPVWERWVLYQVVPQGATNALVVADRAEGAPLLHLERHLMDVGQWDVYLKTGCYASPFWIIQGHSGGHRRRFWPYERTLAEMHGLPGELPDPGSLAYAEIDQRVLDQIHKLDQVARWNKMLEYCDRHHNELDAEEREGQIEVRRQLWKWVQDQTANVFESMVRKDITAALDELPHGLGRGAPIRDYDEWLQQKLTPPGTIIT